MKVGWQRKTLGEVCLIRPPKSEAREKITADNLVSFVPMEDLGIDRKSLNVTKARPLNEVAGSYTYFAEGDVLLAKITPCFENGKLGIASGLSNGIGFGSSEFIVFRPSSVLDRDFLYYYLSRTDFRSEGAARMGGAVGQQRVPKDFIESYPIPVPPLPVQQRIVRILDEAFDGIATAKANAEKNRLNARELFENYLEAVFRQRGEGWEDKLVGEVLKLEYGKPLDQADRNPDGLYPVYGANGVKDRSDRFYYDKPSVIVGRKGSAGEINLSEEKFWPLDVTYFVTFDEQQYYLRFLYYLLTTLDLPSLAKGVKPGINRNEVYSQLATFPPLPEQQLIVRMLDALCEETQSLESIYQVKLAALDELKKSLLHQAFNGAL